MVIQGTHVQNAIIEPPLDKCILRSKDSHTLPHTDNHRERERGHTLSKHTTNTLGQHTSQHPRHPSIVGRSKKPSPEQRSDYTESESSTKGFTESTIASQGEKSWTRPQDFHKPNSRMVTKLKRLAKLSIFFLGLPSPPHSSNDHKLLLGN